MISRKQIRHIQEARGLTPEQIVQKTGIPMQSLMALIFGSETDGKDPNKLMSAATLEKILALLGVSHTFNGLRKNAIIEWRYANLSRKQQASWKDAVLQLRRDFFSDQIHMSEMSAKAGLLKSREHLVFIYDEVSDLRIVVSGVDKSMRTTLETIFKTSISRSDTVTIGEMNFQRRLIENGVYRVKQFDVVMNGLSLKYDWEDVKAAAKEFNYSQEELIDLMVAALRAREDITAKTLVSDQSVSDKNELTAPLRLIPELKCM